MFYADLPLFTQSVCVKFIYFWKFLVLRKRNRDISSFVDHPVYRTFKLHSILFLVFYFDLLVFTQSSCVKVFFLELLGAAWRRSDIASFVERLPYSIFTMYSVLTLGFLFWFVIAYPKCMCKSSGIIFSGNSRCSAKETAMLLLPWCTLCIAFWNYKVHWLLIFQIKSFFFLETFGAPLKKQQYCSFHGAPCIYHFQSRKCLESCLLIFIHMTLVAQIPCSKLICF